MVKIVNDPFKDLEAEKTIEEKKEIHDKIGKQQVKNINLLTTEEEKKINQTLRLPESMINNLKVYSKLHDKSINSVIEDYLTLKFKNKKIIRDRYEHKEETRLLIPKDTRLINQYIKNKINLIVNVTESTDGTIKLNQFDKQSQIFSNNPSSFQLINLRTTNNYLDKYDPKNECYYNELLYEDVLIDKDFELLFEDDNKFKNHIGLIALEHHDITTIEHPFKSYKRVDIEEDKITVNTDTATHVTIFLLVHEYDNIIRTVRIISPKYALKLAEEVENTEIIKYIQDNLAVADILDIQQEYQKEDQLIKQINLLEEINLKLTEKNNSLKTEIDTLTKKLKDNDKEKKDSLAIAEDNYFLVDPEVLAKLSDDIEENNQMFKTYMAFLNTNIQNNLSVLQKLKFLSKYMEDQQKLKESVNEEKLD